MNADNEIRRALEGADRDDGCPVRPLGQAAGTYWFVSPKGELRSVAARDLSTNGILSLFDGDQEWLREAFPKYDKDGNVLEDWAPRAAAAYLMRRCAERGLFDPALSVRGRGVWRGPIDGDRPSLVVHSGDVVTVVGANGRRIEHPPGLLLAKALYAACPACPRPPEEAATEEEGRKLLDAVRLWRFRDDYGPDLVLGFIGAALLGGAPAWRAHLLVTACFGSGKSWLADLVSSALGPQGFAVNNFTEAGLRQMLTGEARALVLDESEPDSKGGRVQQVIELLRHMSSGDGSKSVRGSAEGTARSYEVTGCAYLSSILGVALQPQDRSRITTVELRELTGDVTRGEERARAAIAWAAARSGALRARAMMGWTRFLDNLAVYRDALIAGGCSPRQADQFGTLLAAAEMMTSDATATLDAASDEVTRLTPLIRERREEDVEDSDAQQCLNLLLSSPVEHWRSGSRDTIGMVLLDEMETPSTDTGRVLRSYGMAVRAPRGGPTTLLVANRHAGLARVFRDTKWGDGVWSQSLRRLPDAAPGPVESFGGVKSRCTVVPARHLPEPGERRSSPDVSALSDEMGGV